MASALLAAGESDGAGIRLPVIFVGNAANTILPVPAADTTPLAYGLQLLHCLLLDLRSDAVPRLYGHLMGAPDIFQRLFLRLICGLELQYRFQGLSRALYIIGSSFTTVLTCPSAAFHNIFVASPDL